MKETIRRSKSNCIYDDEQNDEAQYDIKEICRVEIDFFKWKRIFYCKNFNF